MSGFVDLLEIVKKALEEAERDFGKINVLIAGRTGVGKSTLINSVFRGSLATTGQGEPVTQTTRLLSKQGVPLAIWDTRGLEMADIEISKATLSVLVAALTGTAGTVVAGRVVVANLVKLIPGGGAIIGGMISATTAVALTTALGEIYIASLVAVVDRASGEAPAVDAVKREFTRRVARRSARHGSLFEKFRSMADKLLGRSAVRPSA